MDSVVSKNYNLFETLILYDRILKLHHVAKSMLQEMNATMIVKSNLHLFILC